MKKLILTYLKGLAMGAADVVPGVSGGTIAFITGIYEKLLNSIRSFDGKTAKLLLKRDFKGFSQAVNLPFLIALVLGIGTSVVVFASSLSRIVNSPQETMDKVLLFSFFWGLIFASIFQIGREVKRWNIGCIVGLLAGAGFVYMISILTPANAPDTIWFYFLAGACAICAMILPGISGAFILLLMGGYGLVLGSVESILSGNDTASHIIRLGIFGLGCVIGLLSFSRLVHLLLKNAHSITIAVLTGFLVGSLYKIWPWKETLQFRTNSHGEEVPFIQQNLSPEAFATINGDSYWLAAVGMILVGIATLVIFDRINAFMKKKEGGES